MSKLPLRSALRSDADAAQERISLALDATSLDPKLSYADQIHAQLRRAIVDGRLPPATSLSEASLASALGISRQPVREAVRLLAQEGLVQVFPQVGTQVAPISVALIHEGHFVRSALESANLLELVKRITPAQVQGVEANLAAQRAALRDGRIDAFFHLDEAMHRHMFELTGRERVWTLIEASKVHLDRVRWLLLERVKEHAGRALAEHEVLVACLGAGDGAGLAAAIHYHIDTVAEHLLELRQRAPAHYFAD